MTDNEWIELSHEMERQDGFKKREADAIKNNRGKNVQVRFITQSSHAATSDQHHS